MTASHPTHQVVVYVYRHADDGPRYLLVRQEPRREGLWRPVLGTIGLNEAIESAALREVRQETGIRQPLALIDFGFRHREQIGDFDLVDWGLGYDVGRDEPEIRLGREYESFQWLGVEEAYRAIEVDAFRQAVLKLHLKVVG